MSKSIKDDLIKLGNSYPEIQNDLKPVIDKVANRFKNEPLNILIGHYLTQIVLEAIGQNPIKPYTSFYRFSTENKGSHVVELKIEESNKVLFIFELRYEKEHFIFSIKGKNLTRLTGNTDLNKVANEISWEMLAVLDRVAPIEVLRNRGH